MFGYIFYSKKCKFCYELMKLMENYGVNKIFQYECVDTLSIEQITQLQINQVPTIILMPNNGANQTILEGKQAFEWVKQFIINRRQVTIQNAETTRKLIQKNDMTNKLKNNLYDYCPEEQTGISDSYALCREDINIPFPKEFSSSASNDTIITVPIGDIKLYKQKESIGKVYGDVTKIISHAEESRKKQDIEISTAVTQSAVATIQENMYAK